MQSRHHGGPKLTDAAGVSSMIRCSANVARLFPDRPLIDSLAVARTHGFRTVELADPFSVPQVTLASALDHLGLEVGLMNVLVGNMAIGERGLASDPARAAEFLTGLEQSVELVSKIRPRKVNVLSGPRLAGVGEAVQVDQLRRNLVLVSERMRPFGVEVVTEMLSLVDAPEFLLSSVQRVIEVLSPMQGVVGLQLDVYHLQRAQGELIPTIRRLGPLIRHVQIADAPDRTEPGTGEINIPVVLDAIMATGYHGMVGLEYGPSSPDADLFGWMDVARCVPA